MGFGAAAALLPAGADRRYARPGWTTAPPGLSAASRQYGLPPRKTLRLPPGLDPIARSPPSWVILSTRHLGVIATVHGVPVGGPYP